MACITAVNLEGAERHLFLLQTYEFQIQLPRYLVVLKKSDARSECKKVSTLRSACKADKVLGLNSAKH